MLGDDVRVTSRRFNEVSNGAKTLHFKHGADSRPILSDAPEPFRHLSGTVIEVVLREDPYSSTGLIKSKRFAPTHDFVELCSWLCPTFSVQIQVSCDEKNYSVAVDADDWKILPSDQLLNRLIKSVDEGERIDIAEYISLHASFMRDIRNRDGATIGRASVAMSYLMLSSGEGDSLTVTVGGCRCMTGYHIAGVLLGDSSRASRDEASFIGTRDDIDRWAGEQADVLIKAKVSSGTLIYVDTLLETCGIEREELILARSSSGEMNRKALLAYARKHRSITVMDRSEHYTLSQNRHVEYRGSVLMIDRNASNALGYLLAEPCTGYLKWGAKAGETSRHVGFLAKPGFATVAEAWGVSLESLRAVAANSERQDSPKIKVGLDEHGKVVTTHNYFILKRQDAEEWDKNNILE